MLLRRVVEGIVSAGKHLIAAKADVEHNEWLPMLKDIGLEHTMAKRLMAIGRNAGLKGANLHHLPSSVSALYELSRMDPTDIEDGIEAGRKSTTRRCQSIK